MDTKIQFQKNVTVLAADGQQVGSLNRIVMNPENKALTNIVVRTGGLLNHEEKVVPIDLVAGADENQIVLREKAGDLESLPPFEERRLVEADENSTRRTSSLESTPLVMFGKPDFGTNVAPTDPGEQFHTQIEQNIPIGTVAIKEGVRVITAEGEHAGNMESVLTDAAADEVTHLMISRGTFLKETKLVPIKWVTMFGEDEIRLGVKKASVENLADVSNTG